MKTSAAVWPRHTPSLQSQPSFRDKHNFLTNHILRSAEVWGRFHQSPLWRGGVFVFSRCLREDVVLLVQNCPKSQANICCLTLRFGLRQDLKPIRSLIQPLADWSAHTFVSNSVFVSGYIQEEGPSLLRNGEKVSNFSVWIWDLASSTFIQLAKVLLEFARR